MLTHCCTSCLSHRARKQIWTHICVQIVWYCFWAVSTLLFTRCSAFACCEVFCVLCERIRQNYTHRSSFAVINALFLRNRLLTAVARPLEVSAGGRIHWFTDQVCSTCILVKVAGEIFLSCTASSSLETQRFVFKHFTRALKDPGISSFEAESSAALFSVCLCVHSLWNNTHYFLIRRGCLTSLSLETFEWLSEWRMTQRKLQVPWMRYLRTVRLRHDATNRRQC